VGERLSGDGLAAEWACRRETGGDLGGAGEACVVLVRTQHHRWSFFAVKLRGAYPT
jgi:hypothetical protein